MIDSVRIERHSGLRLAVVRRLASRAELSHVVPEACGLVCSTLRSHSVSGAGRHVALYLDDRINLEVGVELDTPFSGVGEVVASSTPAGSVAAVTHLGPYGNLHQAHEAIQEWCRTQGRQLRGPCWELYGHWQPEWNHDPSLIRTDVCYLLRSDKKA